MSNETQDETQPVVNQSTGKALIPAADSPTNTQGMVPVGFFDTASQAVHNFVGTPPEIYRLEMKATGADVGDKTTFPIEGISLRFVYFHKVPIANEESGEITDQIRSVVVDTDGHCWGFVSNGIWQSLLPLLKLYQFGEIKPPMKVRLERIRTANKFEMLRIVPV